MLKALQYLPLLLEILGVVEALRSKNATPREVIEIKPSYKGRKFSVRIATA